MQYVRALKESNCKYFLYENNFSIHKNIKDFISEKLGVQPIMINSSLVSAQNRKRYYWTNIPNIQQPNDKGILLEDIVDPDVLIDKDIAQIIISDIGKTTHKKRLQVINNENQIIYKTIELSNINGGFREKAPRVHLDKSVTIRAGQGGGNIPSFIISNKIKEFNLKEVKKYIRKVSPLECERLQTLPDNYTAGISNTQRYKCIGNGWTVDVIAHILSNIKQEAGNE